MLVIKYIPNNRMININFNKKQIIEKPRIQDIIYTIDNAITKSKFCNLYDGKPVIKIELSISMKNITDSSNKKPSISVIEFDEFSLSRFIPNYITLEKLVKYYKDVMGESFGKVLVKSTVNRKV